MFSSKDPRHPDMFSNKDSLRSFQGRASIDLELFCWNQEGFVRLSLHLLSSFCDVAMLQEDLPPQLLSCRSCSILRTVEWFLTGMIRTSCRHILQYII